MPNICSFCAKIKGEKMEDVKRVLDAFRNDYDKEHLYRIFDATVNSNPEKTDDDEISLEVLGNCAWSVYSCTMSGEHTYYGDFGKGDQGTGTCLEILTKETNTIIEIYSEECGCGFQEHIIIDRGEITKHDCVDYAEHWIDPDEFESIEDYNKEYDTNFTEDMVEDEYVRVGGFENWDFTI